MKRELPRIKTIRGDKHLKKQKKQFVITLLLIFFPTFFLFPLMSLILSDTLGEIIRNGIFSLFFSLGLTYLYFYNYNAEKLDYDNREHPYRFLIVYSIGLLASLVFPLIDCSAWAFMAIGVSIALFTNSFIGAFSASGLMMFSLVLSSGDVVTFFVYFLSTMLAISLFQDIEDNFKVTPYIMSSSIIMVVLEVAGFIMLQNEELSYEQFILIFINLAVNVLAISGSLKYFNQFVANKYRDKFLELNDQEYKALIALKEISKEEYFRSIHTAYLVERMAAATGCDVNVAKNCAYYHRIKKVFEFTKEQCEEFVADNEFPPKAAKLLLDFLDKDSKLIAKESCFVYLSDKFISTLMAIFAEDKTKKIDYEELVSALLDKNFVKDTLSESELTQKDLRTVKEIILKETLYYDFLR